MSTLNKVREILVQNDLDAILISNGFNMNYLSGFAGATGYLFISEHRQIVLTDFRYTIQAELEAKEFEVITIGNGGYVSAINDILKTEHVKKLGFESGDVLYATYESFKKEIADVTLVAVKDEISRLRRVKTADELTKLKRAEAIGDEVFTEILDFIKPGMTELEVAARIEYLLKVKGGQGLSFSAIVASGVNSSMPHAVPSYKKIETGDFVTMDFGCIYEGYCSDMTRTIVIGKASDEQKKVYDKVLEAQLAALDVMKAGLTGKEIDQVARDIIYQAGYEGCFGHGLGHSVGLEIHENPRLSPSEDDVILENVIETVEPGIYIKGFGGVRIEDMVVVTKEGCVNFTHSEKRLIEL